ncbi:hypothetical protein B6V01_003295 [Methanosarcinales archaeon ex4572_44]|nr:MAG: hypothetical protein B6V01_003295 [Methanosarcinales archaeon ex4572_44]HHI30901.1 hypothetical protein [Candidatus Methanoperedenaceae archaeon]
MIKLGKIGFANCDFPYYAIEAGIIPTRGVEVVESHPVDLARMIAACNLDLTPISSIMYPQIEGLLVLPGICIASDDFTRSVLVCSNGITSLEELEGRTLCLPDVSASSSTLIQIILHVKGIVDVDIRTCAGQKSVEMLELGDAALFIGDQALIASHECNVVADLGREWHNLTGAKMVYAVWVVRREFAEEEPDRVRYIHSKLLESKEYGYRHREEIAKVISEKKGFDEEMMKDYLHTLNYELDEKSIESLNTYFKYAEECGFIAERKSIVLFEG